LLWHSPWASHSFAFFKTFFIQFHEKSIYHTTNFSNLATSFIQLDIAWNYSRASLHCMFDHYQPGTLTNPFIGFWTHPLSGFLLVYTPVSPDDLSADETALFGDG